MKKFLIVALTILLVTGCGTSKEEKEKMLFNSLEKAYISVYTADGVGLAVYPNETQEVDGETWYLVAVNKYSNIEKLLANSKEVYTDSIANDLNEKIKARYRQFDTDLYTPSTGGCPLDYIVSSDGDLQKDIKENVEIKKVKMNKIIFEYKGEEYTAKKEDDHYVFDKRIFTCIEEG